MSIDQHAFSHPPLVPRHEFPPRHNNGETFSKQGEAKNRGTGPSSLWRGCRACACNRPGFVAHSFVPGLTPAWTRACGRDTIPYNGHNEHGVDRLGSAHPGTFVKNGRPRIGIAAFLGPCPFLPDLSISLRLSSNAFTLNAVLQTLSFSLDSVLSLLLAAVNNDFLPFW